MLTRPGLVQIVDLWDHQKPGGTAFYGRGSQEESGDIELKAGVPAKVVVEYSSQKPEGVASSGPILMVSASPGCCRRGKMLID
jgi:hypothetical protein